LFVVPPLGGLTTKLNFLHPKDEGNDKG